MLSHMITSHKDERLIQLKVGLPVLVLATFPYAFPFMLHDVRAVANTNISLTLQDGCHGSGKIVTVLAVRRNRNLMLCIIVETSTNVRGTFLSLSRIMEVL